MSTKSAIWAGKGLGWHRGCQEVANHSEGLGERGEGWQGMGTKGRMLWSNWNMMSASSLASWGPHSLAHMSAQGSSGRRTVTLGGGGVSMKAA